MKRDEEIGKLCGALQGYKTILGYIREDIKEIKTDINLIRTNELHHVDMRLNKLENFKATALAWAAVGAIVGTAIVQLVIFLIRDYLIK